MTNAELQQLTEQWSKECFRRGFTHKVFFNKRLKTTGRRYHLGDHHIDINLLIYTELDLHKLRQMVLHELYHHHLHLLEMGHHHRNREFKTLLAQVGGSRYALPTNERKTDSKKK